MTENKKTGASKFGSRLKEFIRKILVFLKKKPDIFPILALVASFLIYSLNLTVVSNTTAKIYGEHMGLCSFVVMLFMILSFVCMLGAYPKRQKPKWVMIVLMTVMYIIVILADLLYYYRIYSAVNRAENPIKITTSTAYIASAQSLMIVHIISVVVIIALIYLEPLIARLLKKINTSIEVEGTSVESIELSDDE